MSRPKHVVVNMTMIFTVLGYSDPVIDIDMSMRDYIYIQGVPGGMCQTSGGCSLC